MAERGCFNLQNTFYSMLLFYRCTVHKLLCFAMMLATWIQKSAYWIVGTQLTILLTTAFILHPCTWNKHSHFGLSYNCSPLLLLVLKKKLEVILLQRVILVICGFCGFFFLLHLRANCSSLWFVMNSVCKFEWRVQNFRAKKLSYVALLET